MHLRWFWILLALAVALAAMALTQRHGKKVVRQQQQRNTAMARYYRLPQPKDPVPGLLFIHHSCGLNWLNDGLLEALLAKPYIEAVTDVDYKVAVPNDPDRPASLGESAGDYTDACHWILWFNDYLGSLKTFRRVGGTQTNRIIMFKSCYPMSQVTADGAEPGEPFSAELTLANYRAVFRHPEAPGKEYEREGYRYKALEDVFAANPDTLFVFITSPPLSNDRNDDASAHRARIFCQWVKGEWLASYNKSHPGLRNVAVFDWFDILANPDDSEEFPNRLKAEYGGRTSNSHPKRIANQRSTELFASDPDSFLDQAWTAFEAAQAKR